MVKDLKDHTKRHELYLASSRERLEVQEGVVTWAELHFKSSQRGQMQME